jgi:alkylated DNA repair dioxygenase AlkB
VTPPGLAYLPAYVAEDEAARLLAAIDGEPWLGDLERRVQHYGWRYDYKARSVAASSCLGPLPAWAAALAGRLVAERLVPEMPDQAIVNEYTPGQGIAPHVDCVPCFGAAIASLSLGSACALEMTRRGDSEKVTLLLEPRSVLVLSGEARYGWRHGIPRRKKDIVGGRTVVRARRVSITFRKVLRGSGGAS